MCTAIIIGGLAYHNFWVDILSNFYLLELCFSWEGVSIQPVHKHLIIANTRVHILRGMDVSVHQTRKEKLTGKSESIIIIDDRNAYRVHFIYRYILLIKKRLCMVKGACMWPPFTGSLPYSLPDDCYSIDSKVLII